MSNRLPVIRMVGLLGCVFLVLGASGRGQNRPIIPRLPLGGAAPSKSAPPVSVSPGNWSQLAKLVPPGCCAGLENVTAVSGDTVAVGLIPFAGGVVADVFVKTSLGWRSNGPIARLSGPVPTEPYIAPVAVDGDTIVTAGNIGFGKLPGYAFVYVKPVGGWTDMSQTAILSPSDNNVDFGDSVSVSGDTIVVGSNGYQSGTPGAAYVFVRPASGWHNMTETAKLTSSDGMKNDLFGWSVSINGKTIAVGAPQFGDITNPGPGKAYVFVEPSTGWTSMTQNGELTGSDSVNRDAFGFSVSVDEDVVLAGAYVHNGFLGEVYVYQKPPAGWSNMTQTAALTPGDGIVGEFGYSVAINGKIAIVGAPYRGLPPNASEGGLYVFSQPASGWQNMAGNTVLTGADAHFSDAIGYTVGISGKTAVGGAPYRPAPGNAYVFGLP